jgi:hypothetical protein
MPIAIGLLSGVFLPVLCASAAEPPRLHMVPGKPLKYRIERELTATTKVLGETNTTNYKVIWDVAGTAGDPDEMGRIPLSLKVTHVEGSAPAFESLSPRQVEFNDVQHPMGTAIPAWHFLPGLAMKKHPLTLVYEPRGTLADVKGHEALAAEFDAMLVRDFQRHVDFGPTRAVFRQIYTPSVQKALWEDLLIVDLPAEAAPGAEWKERRLAYLQPFYVWIDTTCVAEEAEGGLHVETAYKMPKGKTASVKFEVQEFEYSVKNGEGSGSLLLDGDGQVGKLNTTWHVYFDLTAIPFGQRTPVDELYQRLKQTVTRHE